jgi:hypothetical protein
MLEQAPPFSTSRCRKLIGDKLLTVAVSTKCRRRAPNSQAITLS